MGLYHNIFLLLNITEIKGRTIRRVIGGGEESFRAAGIFLRYQIPCMNFFLAHSMNIF